MNSFILRSVFSDINKLISCCQEMYFLISTKEFHDFKKLILDMKKLGLSISFTCHIKDLTFDQ